MATKDISDFQVCLAYWVRGYMIAKKPAAILFSDTVLQALTGQHMKVCAAAMERAETRRLLDCGVTLRSGWLTDQGTALIADYLCRPSTSAQTVLAYVIWEYIESHYPKELTAVFPNNYLSRFTPAAYLEFLTNYDAGEASKAVARARVDGLLEQNPFVQRVIPTQKGLDVLAQSGKWATLDLVKLQHDKLTILVGGMTSTTPL